LIISYSTASYLIEATQKEYIKQIKENPPLRRI